MPDTARELRLETSPPGHWYGADLRDSAWRVPIPTAAIDEVDTALRVDAREWAAMAPDLQALRAFLHQVRERLFHGSGAVVARRLPLDEWGDERGRNAVALIARLMGSPVQQTNDGVCLYEVEDRGLTPAPGVRRSRTNVSQPYHCDGPWVRQPPWVVGLHCLQPARRGGISRCISLRALFDDLGAESPALLRRLAQDFYWHRQGEHAPGESPVSRFPIWWHDEQGRWCARYYGDYVVSGFRAAGVAMDPLATKALESLERMSRERHRRLEFTLRSGEIEWLNNRWCAHARTAFESAGEAPRPRLMFRVWHRFDGDPVDLDT